MGNCQPNLTIRWLGSERARSQLQRDSSDRTPTLLHTCVLTHARADVADELLRTGQADPLALANVEWLLHHSSPTLLRCEYASVTALQLAALAGYESVVQVILSYQRDIDQTAGNTHFTALHLAAMKGHRNVVTLLLDAGADFEVADTKGCTALHRAILNGFSEIAELLLAKGADIEAITRAGCTALHCAVKRRSAELVNLLLSAGADVNAVSSQRGKTALHFAALANHEPTVLLLLQWGADPTIPDQDGNTAQQLAERKRYTKIASLFAADHKAVELILK